MANKLMISEDKEMVDYRQAWKVRKIQIIVINAIFAVLGIVTVFSDKNLVEGLTLWFFGAWIVETLISAFSKSGDKVSSLARNVGATLFSGTFAAASGGSTLWVFFFMISMIKAMFGAAVISAILAFEFVAFPFTSIYYFVRSRQQASYSPVVSNSTTTV